MTSLPARPQALTALAIAPIAGFLLVSAACEPLRPYDEAAMELHPLAGNPLQPTVAKYERAEDTGAGDHPVDGADPHAADGHAASDPWVQVGQIAAGRVTGEALDQPIAFTHWRHVSVLQMDCEYCHTYARESVHSGPPPVEMCMGCHQHVFTESAEIQKLTAYWERGEPIPWQKVHDLPDYVYFSHKRHVRAGVDCTECHGQVPLMGRWPDGDPSRAEVMVREATLQMGWCLDCHAEHPSIDENYGEAADARRAELKDCWTCHK